MTIEARNNFVFIKRDEIEKESRGLVIPGQGQEKPNTGIILSVGGNVLDKELRKDKGKKAVFHKGNGFDIDYVGETFLVIEGERIIGVDEARK